MGMLDVRDHRAVSLRSTSSRCRPDLVLHLAAETDLETCELRSRPRLPHRTPIGTEYVALASRDQGIPLVYISTAGVFDGTKTSAYTEFDDGHPINVYGASKFEGELVALRLNPHTSTSSGPAGWSVAPIVTTSSCAR